MLAAVMGGTAIPTGAAAQATQPATIGTLTIQRYGDHGRPLILIPGLASGAWVWDAVRSDLARDHVVYTVTLAGFDGIAPPPGDGSLFDRADSSLLALVRSRHIDKPVLVGHSLGGTLAIRFACEHSDLLGGVVAVDGLPVFPGTERMTAEQRAAAARQLRDQFGRVTPAQFKAQQLGYMQHVGVLDPKKAAEYAALTGRSDPVATGRYAAEDFLVDLRPRLKNMTVPLLEISPYNAPDFTAGSMSMSEAQKTAYYEHLLHGAPHATVMSIAPSRHFVMLDQPRRVAQLLHHFLAAHP
jgi:pimeloyl-ACP methyl ester carboxylesterase